MKKRLVLVLLLILGGLLFVNFTLYMEMEPVVDKISDHYIEAGVEETGSYNLVTAILYDYRGFDSLGESTVIFAAVSGIVLILSRKTLPVSSHGLTFIVKRTFGILTPFVFLFSMYIITHAHLSPGGGFQ
ncbi:MAG: hydrogen gas-evolving membrane-bound hydrogenase subunit E, partial [Halanaerobiales bacterium]